MRQLAEPRMRAAPFEIRLLDLPGEEIPLEDGSVDTVVLTYTLCTIPDGPRALAGMRRVLKSGGELLFCEHGEAPDPGVCRWQRRVEPIWRRIAGGCHLTRPVPSLISAAGFRIRELETMYLPRTPRIAGFQYWGVAE
jgi:ubiquinone/menaquinone biosynthesis C-methylase UbiE